MATQTHIGSANGARENATNTAAPWHGTAFLVEALVLLAFLIASIALFMQLFGQARVVGAESSERTQAVLVASDNAERFAVDPQSVPATQTVEDFQVTCDVQPEVTEAGTLYRAEIAVFDGDEELYRLSTARYVSEVE